MKGPERGLALSVSYIKSADSLLPQFPASKRRAPVNQFQQAAREEPWMRRRLRRSIPFLLAIFFGMIAGVLVAGIAILAAHP
jgi:hypothetical protein